MMSIPRCALRLNVLRVDAELPESVNERLHRQVDLLIILVLRPQVLHTHHALLPFVGRHKDDPLTTHAVGVAEGLLDLLGRLEEDIDGKLGLPQPRRDAHGVRSHLRVVCDDHKVDVRLEIRQEP